MLIECMATSRASSLPMSTLYKSLMQSYPSLKSRGTEGECLDILERVLENGTVANGGSGVFGKVQSSGHVRYLIYYLRSYLRLTLRLLFRMTLIGRWRHSGSTCPSAIRIRSAPC
jgi:hypothetical protein